jgi:hypothetical protein
MSDKVILVATVGKSMKLYLIVSDAVPGKDAIVASGGNLTEVGLWSYVTKVPVTPLRLTSWHKKLWDGPEDDEWSAYFVNRTKSFSSAEMKEMGAVSSDEILVSSRDNPEDDWFNS